jgi:Tfp pilus assembly protein PilF
VLSSFAPALARLAAGARRAPSGALAPALDPLFGQLACCRSEVDALAVEDRIWALWMYHPHRVAAHHLDRAATEIATHCHDMAETRLAQLVRRAPDYSEAWNKRATLYYLQERDAECVDALCRVLDLEPRHFGAMCALAELLASHGDTAGARFAFAAALRVHPRHVEARARLDALH